MIGLTPDITEATVIRHGVLRLAVHARAPVARLAHGDGAVLREHAQGGAGGHLPRPVEGHRVGGQRLRIIRRQRDPPLGTNQRLLCLPL